MTLRISKLNSSGFTATQLDIVDGEQTYVDSAYEAFDSFSIDITFEGAYEEYSISPEEATYVYANAIDVTSTFDWTSIGITYSKPNTYTVRLVGPATNIFLDQFYKFKLTDYSEQILPANTDQSFFGLVHYQMPDPTYTMKVYPFTVTIPKDASEIGPYYDDNENLILSKVDIEDVDMKQWFYWRYQPAIANIDAANARGLK